MIDALITNPPWIYKTRFSGERYGVRAGSRWPATGSRSLGYQYVPYPLFMGYATSYLRSRGIEAEFYDAIAQHHNYEIFFNIVDKYKPKIVIQETSTPSFDVDIEIAKRLHSKKYEVCLVGSHTTAFAEELIKLPFVDYIIKGEYEYMSLEMVQTERKGIYDFKQVKDLDALPYPYRDRTMIYHYSEACCSKKLGYPQLWVYASRGCAFHCEFCIWVHSMYNNKFTLRQPKKVLGEIDDMLTKYNFKYILFDDDCWNIGGDKRLIELADGLYKIGIPWSILGRIDTCSKETFKYLVDRGCVGLRLGIESLSQNLLDRMDKKLKVETILDVLNYLETLDVSIYLCFMHYVPGETKTNRLEHSRKIKELGIKFQNPPCVPFPGTPYYGKLIKAGFLTVRNIRWREYDGGNIGTNLLKIIKKYSTAVKG